MPSRSKKDKQHQTKGGNSDGGQALFGEMTNRRYFMLIVFFAVLFQYYWSLWPLSNNVLINRHHSQMFHSFDSLEMNYYGNNELIFELFPLSAYVGSNIAHPVISHFQWTDGLHWNNDLGILLFTDPHLNKLYSYSINNGPNIISNDCGDIKTIDKRKLSTMGEPGCNSVIIDSKNNVTYIAQFGTKHIISINSMNIYDNEQINNFNIDSEKNEDSMTMADKIKHDIIMNGIYNGKSLNGPAHLIIHKNYLYFSDPQYGLSKLEFGNFEQSDIGFYGVYRINLNDKTFELIESQIDSPNGIVFHPNGKFMYVSNCLDGKFEIWVYHIDTATDKIKFIKKWNNQQSVKNFKLVESHSSFQSGKMEDVPGCVDGMMIESWPQSLSKFKETKDGSDNDVALLMTTCAGGQICILEVYNDNAILHSVVRFPQGAILSGLVKATDGHVYVSGLNSVWAMKFNQDVW